jgi:hypothetical protein
LLPSALQIVKGRFDLRSHAARRKVPLAQVPPGLSGAQVVKQFLVGTAEVEGHLVDAG